MEDNHLTSPVVFSQNGQSKDTKTIAESIKLKPVFDDLNKPAAFLTHLEQLKNTFDVENKAASIPFPVAVFPKAVQEIITATNECLNFPIDFIGASILAAVSVAVGNTHRIEIKTGWQESAVLYISIVGRPGTNKTHPRLALCLEMTMYACGESDKQSIGIDALEGALQLVEYFCKSALEVRSILSNASPLDGLDEKKRTIYKELPEKFSTSEGVQIAAGGGMTERSFKRFLTIRDLFFHIERGEYEKLV